MFSVCKGFVSLGTSAVHASGAKNNTCQPGTHHPALGDGLSSAHAFSLGDLSHGVFREGPAGPGVL